MKKWKDRFIKSSFDRKMNLIVTLAVVVTTVLILLVSTVSSVESMKKQSIALLQSQNETIVENFRDSLETYKALAVATVLDSSVQQYVKMDKDTNANAAILAQNAYNMLGSINNIYANLNFIALVKNNTKEYLFMGKDPITTTRFLQMYQIDEQKCKMPRQSTIKMGFHDSYYDGKRYTLSIYFPIYDAEQIFVDYGLLCMNFRDINLAQITETGNASDTGTFVVDTDGMLVASGNEDRIGTYIDYMDELRGDKGEFEKDGNLYIYHKVDDWNFYVVNSVAKMALYSSSFRTIFVMIAVLAVILMISIRVVRKIIGTVYYPLNKVVKKMDDVASGSLKTRINVENMGEDFTKLAVGFNTMMEEIQVLMEQVKLEQHQIEQIRFNALQSQIQPHFLYNTLECIHWQAIADGNQEISTLVKALAKYYRICLSKGEDFIPLHVELEHIRNYLIIQNIRYDNIIESVFEIDEEVTDTMIPKLTLQPLVENSIYHGMKIKEGKKGILFVSVKKKEDKVLITVSDTGTGMEEDKIHEMNLLLKQYDDSFGYGVRNVNKRIELFYGTEYGLHYLKNESGGVTVEILLPYDTNRKGSILRGENQHV